MPTLDIEGYKIKVDDSFLSLSPEEQNATVDEIAQSLQISPVQQTGRSQQSMASKAGDFLKHTATNALDTLSLGWNDEAAAGLAALPALMPGGESYSEAYQRHHQGQQRLVDEADQDTVAKVAGQTIGLAPAMLATAGGAGAATAVRAAPRLTGAPRMAGAALDAVRPAATAGGRVRQGAAFGGLAGTVGGMGGENGDMVDRAAAGVKGGAIGTLAGGTVAGASEALPAIVGGVSRMIGRSPQQSLPQRAARRVTDRFAKDGMSPESVVDTVRRSRDAGADEFALLDAGRSNVHGLARSTANTPGRGGDILRDFVQGRKAGQYSRNIRAIEDNLGPINNPEQVKLRAREQAKDVVEPLYKAAHPERLPVDVDMRNVLSRPSVKAAAKRSSRLYAEEGRQAPQLYNDKGDVLENLADISVEQLHYIREGIDAQIAKGRAIDPQFSNSREGMLLNQTRQLIDQRLKRGSDRMSLADQRFSGMMRDVEALDRGYQYPTTRPRELDAFQNTASRTEKEMYSEGARARMGDELGKLRDGRDISKAFLSTPNQRHAIGSVAPNQTKADRFNEYLAAERRMANSQNEVVGNSTTARQLAMQQSEGLAASEKGGQMIRSGIVPMVKDTLARMVEKTGSISDAERQVIAEMLTNTSEEGLQEFLDYAMQRAVQQIARQQAIGPVTTLGGYMSGQWARD